MSWQDWTSIKDKHRPHRTPRKVRGGRRKHDEKKHKSRLKLAKQRAAAVEEYKLELEKQRVAISGLEDIEVEGVVQTKLPDELQQEVDVGETPKPPSGLDVVLESVHDALKKDFPCYREGSSTTTAPVKTFSRSDPSGHLEDRWTPSSRVPWTLRQLAAEPRLADGGEPRVDGDESPEFAVRIGGFFSEPESANYIQPNNLFGLHEPHFRVLLREVGLKLPGRKARRLLKGPPRARR